MPTLVTRLIGISYLAGGSANILFWFDLAGGFEKLPMKWPVIQESGSISSDGLLLVGLEGFYAGIEV